MRVFVISCAVLFILIFIGAAFAFSGVAFGDSSAMSSKDWINWISRGVSEERWIAKYGTYYGRNITFIEATSEDGYITEYWQIVVKYETGYDFWNAKIIYKDTYSSESIPKSAIKTLRSDAQYFVNKE